MSDESQLADRIEALLADPIAELGVRLLDSEFRNEGGWVLRLFIDREGGVSLQDCTAASRRAEEVLDEEDPIPGEYNLEVTSLGIFRPLKKPKHFQQSVGKEVKLRLADGHFPERKKRNYRGVLSVAAENGIVITIDKEQLELTYDAIQSAKLDPKI